MDDQKRNEQRAKLNAMFREEFLGMKHKGATAADLREPCVHGPAQRASIPTARKTVERRS
jgi:hypothetical protein